MTKFYAFFAALAVVVMPYASKAAVRSDSSLLNDAPTAVVEKGETVQATLFIEVTSNEDLESFSYEIPGTNLPRVCVDVDDEVDFGYFNFAFDFNAPQNTGTKSVLSKTYGDNGAGANNQCLDIPTDTMTVSNRLTVSAGASTRTPSTSTMSWIDKLIASLLAALKPVTPTPSVSPLCAQYSALSSTKYGSYGAAGLQSFLSSHGYRIPAGATGFYGSQTSAAVASFQAVNRCN
jgi:hypothetical protein